MQIIPLQAVPNQAVTVTLNDQNCQINVYSKRYGLFLDLYMNNEIVLAGILCRNLRLMLMNTYFGFVGDLIWLDNQGVSDPNYEGLSGRFSLVYLLPSDIPSTSLYQ